MTLNKLENTLIPSFSIQLIEQREVPNLIGKMAEVSSQRIITPDDSLASAHSGDPGIIYFMYSIMLVSLAASDEGVIW